MSPEPSPEPFTGNVIALRYNKNDEALWLETQNLADKHGLSLNVTVKMLLGYAFNEINKSGKEFTPKVVFESE